MSYVIKTVSEPNASSEWGGGSEHHFFSRHVAFDIGDGECVEARMIHEQWQAKQKGGQ